MIAKNKNIAGMIAMTVISIFCVSGCSNNSTMSDQDAKNFKGGGTMTDEDRKKMATGIDDFYKTHPQYRQANTAQAPAGPVTPAAAK